MPTATTPARVSTVNDEGFFENPDEWTEEMAPEIARPQASTNSPSSTGG